MKVWKKNLIAAAILVTVCAGIYVNWRYTEDQAAANLTDTLDTEKVMSDDNLVLSEDMAAIRKLDEGESLFFSHYDPATVEMLTNMGKTRIV